MGTEEHLLQTSLKILFASLPIAKTQVAFPKAGIQTDRFGEGCALREPDVKTHQIHIGLVG